MSTLTSHLRDAGDHGALAFHPSCPICRDQRLHGTLDAGPLVSARTRAALAAGVLAVSVVPPLPTAVAGAEPPPEHEGQVAPEDSGAPGDSAQSPDFDPGGPATELPVPVGPEDPESESDAPTPLESEPEIDPGVVPELPTTPDIAPEVPVAPEVQEQPPPEASVPPAPQTEVAPSPELQVPTPPVEPVQEFEPDQPDAKQPGGHRRDRDHTEARKQPKPRSTAPTAPPTSTDDVVTTESVTVETSVSSGSAATDVSAPARVRPGDRMHVVQRGDSLWSIARAVAGQDASIAEVAREVSRLWDLNRQRIGTGDPDLILPGTQLRLR